MNIEPIRFIMPKFTFGEDRPAAGIYVHLDILGDDEVRYQHFNTDELGRLMSGNKPAIVRAGKYALCATSNDVQDDLIEGYEPVKITIEEDGVVEIPEDIIVEWEFKDLHEYIKTLEGEREKYETETEDMQKQITLLEDAKAQLEREREIFTIDGEVTDDERLKLQNIYSNIEIAKKKIDENWELVEKGKTKLKILLDKQVDTLEYLEFAEKEKEDLKQLREELEQKKRQVDLVFNAIVGKDERIESLIEMPGEEEAVITIGEDLEGIYTAPDLETLQKIRQHIVSINEKRRQVEKAREKILEAREQLKNRKEGMIELSDEMSNTLRQYDQLLGEIQEEKETLVKIKSKLFQGWEKLKTEYSERVLAVENEFRTLEKEKASLMIRKDKIKDLMSEGRDRLQTEKGHLGMKTDKVKGMFLEGRDRVQTEKTEILDDRRKLSELGSELSKQSVKIKEAVIAKRKFEERYDALKEDEKALEQRDMELRRQMRKMQRDHMLRMEAYSQNDQDIEAEFTALEDMRDLIKVQREDFVKDRLKFLKESMYYECPVCGGTIPVKSSKRPLRVQCPSCVTEFNLKVKNKYQCPECDETILVTTSKRPINVKCQKCGSEFIIRKPFKHEEEIIPDAMKTKIKA